MSQPVANFKEGALYLDAMIPYALLRQIDAEIVKALFHRIQSGEIEAFTSALTFDELAYRLLLAAIRDNHPGNPLQNLRQNESHLISGYAPESPLNWKSCETSPISSLWILAQQTSCKCCNSYLRPRDALHLAAMHKCACFNLVSQDADFDHAPMIQRFTI